MWQFLLAAAVAGSGFLARRLIFNSGRDPTKGCASDLSRLSFLEEDDETLVKEGGGGGGGEGVVDVPSLILSGPAETGGSWSLERESSEVGDEGIFRFSSFCRRGGSESRLGSKGLRKKAGLGGKTDGGVKRVVAVQRIEKKLDSVKADEMIVNKQKKKGRKFIVCLKRRRTGKNACGKWETCCSEGSSRFSWGLGVGIMCMISAGKAEINKLNVAIDEAKEVINDLKYKLYKGKLSLDLQDPSFEKRAHQCIKETMGDKKLENIMSGAEGTNLADIEVSGLQFSGDCEYASSVLTEESEPQVPEIDLLEAELESELQKISCYASGKHSSLRGEKPNLAELDQDPVDVKNTGVSGGLLGSYEQFSKDCNFFQSHGVSPYELDRKLCHLLIVQQESHIVELESKLRSTYVRLHDKEAELLSLKNCVRHFRDLSLETRSDEETEEAEELDEQGRNIGSDSPVSSEMLFDSGRSRVTTGQRVVVGTKRAMDSEPCDYIVNN